MPSPPHSPQPRGTSPLLTLPLLCLLVTLAHAAAPTPAGAADDASGPDAEFFEKRVRPILAQRCHECHSHSAKKLRSELYLDSRAGVLRGGERGPAITPGDPAASRLIEAVSYTSTDLQMPPKRQLPAAEVATLTEWVRRGAPWPTTDKDPAPLTARSPTSGGSGGGGKKFDVAARKAEHWCWQPVKAVAPPPVRDAAWPLDDTDRFILAALEGRGLKPAPPADKRTLIRRASFDLTGLPPTPTEVETFVNDASAGAFAAVVDRLLASSRFGERWARHWLDLMRYAETFGHEFDHPIPHAWKYRDYLIRALNADLPYNQFITEHVAGDLLPNPRLHPTRKFNESIIATGGWFFHEQTHAPVDARLHQADRIDNQIDTLTKTFLGVTVACARCHDHKFDAISTKDYYALFGYFESSRFQQAWIDPEGKVDAAVGRLTHLRHEADELMASASSARVTPEPLPPPAGPAATAQGRLGKNALEPPTLPDGGSPGSLADVTFETFDQPGWQGWYPSGWAWGAGPTRPGQWEPRDTAGVSEALPGVAHSGLLSDKLPGVLRSKTFTLTHPAVHFRLAGKGRVRVVVDGYMMNDYSALLFSGLIQKIDSPDRFTWVTVGGSLNKYIGHRAHIELIDDGEGSLLVDEIRFSENPKPDPPAQPVGLPVAHVTDAMRSRVSHIREQVAAIDAALTTPEQVLAMADGNGYDERVFIRGSHRSLGDVVPRRFLEALGGQASPAPAHTSGRLQLARQIADPANPLTARVIVNRVWHHLTGRGIVPTVDNFGVLGQPPTHPELLDHLATRFVKDGWSLKGMIRTVMLSRTYQMATSGGDADEAGELADPANLLLHRMNVKRMEGEVIRDFILCVSGRLDEKMFGPPVPILLTSFMDGRGKPKASGPLDGDGRRSVYIEVRRNFLSPMMLAFDTPQPFQAIGRRSVSNVPAQALILMNDPLVVTEAKRWAERLASAQATPQQRVTDMYLTAFSRPPSQAEVAEALSFVQSQAGALGRPLDHPDTWADLCHVMMNVKEFVFVY